MVLALLTVTSWRTVFVSFGSVGLVWVAVWYRWFRDEPSDHPRQRGRVAAIVADRPPDCPHPTDLATGVSCSAAQHAGSVRDVYSELHDFYFCITWLPTYLRERHGFDVPAWPSSPACPCIVSMPGDLLGGLVTDAVTARYGLRVGRCAVGAAAY